MNATALRRFLSLTIFSALIGMIGCLFENPAIAAIGAVLTLFFAACALSAEIKTGEVKTQQFYKEFADADCRALETKAIRAIRRGANYMRDMHHTIFPRNFAQAGSVGIDLKTNSTRARGKGEQKGANHRAGAESGDGNNKDGDSDPDPERPLLYSFSSAASLLDCSAKTLRNKASLGIIPVVHTIIGPRITALVIEQIAAGTFRPFNPHHHEVAPARTRGRPRIAASGGKGVRHD